MFIAAWLTINKIQNKPKCPLIDEWAKKIWKDIPGGLVVKNLPTIAGDTGLIPVDQRDSTSHVVQRESTCHGATKPMCHNCQTHVAQLLKPTHLGPVLHNKRSQHSEKAVHYSEEQHLLAATRANKATKTQHSQESINFFKRRYEPEYYSSTRKNGILPFVTT